MIDHKETPRTDISPWTAEFRDPATETAYRRRNAPFYIRHARFGLGLWGALLLLFVCSDYMNLGTAPGFWILMGMRLTVVAAILAFGLIIGRYPGLVMAGHGMAGLLIFGWTGFFLVFFFLPVNVLPYSIAMVMAMLIGQFVFIPNRVSTGSAAALYAIAGTLACVHLVAGAGPANLTALFMMLLVPSATGLFVCHRFQSEHRRAFAMLLDAERANAELEREIRARKELEAELKRLAATDPLTGLNNRRQYEALFTRELKRVQRYGGVLSLLVIDLDHFKQVNDTYGHSAGDSALQQAAGICRSHLREVDIIGRLGGEEFVVMLPDTALADALVVAERLRQKISAEDFKTPQGRVRLTVSIGVTQCRPGENSIAELIRRADAALYQAKAGGRDRVVARE